MKRREGERRVIKARKAERYRMLISLGDKFATDDGHNLRKRTRFGGHSSFTNRDSKDRVTPTRRNVRASIKLELAQWEKAKAEDVAAAKALQEHRDWLWETYLEMFDPCSTVNYHIDGPLYAEMIQEAERRRAA